MDVKAEKAFVVRMNAEEAGVILGLLELIGGPPDSLGRSVAICLMDALDEAGAIPIEAFEMCDIESKP